MVRQDVYHQLIRSKSSYKLGKSRTWSLKDGAYYCYCAYVLRISRYSDFLSAVLINTGIFLRGSKLREGSRTYQVLLVSKKKIGGNHAFLRDNQASI